MRNAIIVTLIVAIFVSCRKPEPAFNLNGKCSLTFMNDTEDAATIQIRNQYLVPLTSAEIDTTLAPRSSLNLELVAQANNYIDLLINDVAYKLLTQPGSSDSLKILKDANGSSIVFSGKLKKVNQFLLLKSEKFNSAHADILPRVAATNESKTFNRVVQVNDSVTNLHLGFLEQNAGLLPKWYLTFEKKRLEYLNAGFKLNSLSYRREMLHFDDKVPENFLADAIDALPIHDEEMTGNISYMIFLSDYMGYKADLSNPKYKADTQKEWKNRLNHLMEVTDRELSGHVKDVFLAYSLSMLLEVRRNAFDEKWLQLIQNKELKDVIISQSAKAPLLPKGSGIPYFYLQDSNNNYFQPSQFKNKIVLINFWATWCKPCLKEFPYENKLVEQFKTKPVTILNICVESDSVLWRNMIRKHNLKTVNLFAQGNWSEKLNEQYGIQALPHSILIDWQGKVVQNKCPKPSEDVDELITALLLKMEQKSVSSRK